MTTIMVSTTWACGSICPAGYMLEMIDLGNAPRARVDWATEQGYAGPVGKGRQLKLMEAGQPRSRLAAAR
jgi:hypothetical protein